MRRKALIAVLIMAASALGWCESAKDRWQAGASIYTESGDYGGATKTSTFYMPFSLRRLFDPGSLELIVPFISVTSQGQVVVVGGTPNSSGRDRGGAGTSGTTTTQVTHSGIGDMVFKGRYYAVEERDWIPAVDAVGRIKFPTASRSDGLGTGEFDEGFDLELTKTIETRYVGLGDLGYTFIGSPPGASFNNQWNYSLGLGYYFIPKKLMASATFEETRALVSGESNPKDLLFDAQYEVNSRIRVYGGLQAGLTRSTADYGLHFGARMKFSAFPSFRAGA